MWRTSLLAVVLLLCSAPVLCAQLGGRYAISGGLTSESLAYPAGYHLRGSLRLPVSLPRSQFQVEGLLASTDHSFDLVATANVAVKPVQRAWAPYFTVGTGLYAGGGIPVAFNGGIGLDVPVRLSIGSAPVRDHAVFVEYRGYRAGRFFSALSIGVRR